MRRPDRSSSRSPSRFSSERTWRLTAGCVTPSRSAACENERRSTTAQNACNWRVSIRVAYSTLGVAARPARLRLPELEAVAEGILGEEPGRARDRVVVARLLAGLPQPPAQRLQVVDHEARMGLSGRSEAVLDADVELLRAGPEPAAAACAERLGLRQLRQTEEPAVERARLLLAAARRRDLHVIDAGDFHGQGLPSPPWHPRHLSRTRWSPATPVWPATPPTAGSTSSSASSTSSSSSRSASCCSPWRC